MTRIPLWILAVSGAGLYSAPAALAVSTLGLLHVLLIALDHHNARLGVDHHGLILLRVGLSRRAEFLPRTRIQARSLLQSPLDRLFGLARVRLDVAGGGAMSWLTLPPLELDRAMEVLRRLESGCGCGDYR